MKLLILSDLHLEFGIFNVPKVDYDAVILAGDIFVPGSKAMRWARRAGNFGETAPILFVPGNHEFYEGVLQTSLKEMALTARACNVHLLAPGEAVIAGVRFLGCTLWTDFELPIQTKTELLVDTERAMKAAKVRLNDYSAIRWAEAQESCDAPVVAAKSRKRRLVPEDTLALHQRDRAWLAQKLAEPFDGPTVVVTHHAPHRNSLVRHYQSDWLSPSFVSELPSSFFEVPSLWIHGHLHDSYAYQAGNCRVVCNPRGYLQHGSGLENKQFNPEFVVEL
ncbi:3',5'-cyclic AMP phosphodiesterase CpdA [Variovorax sp. YR634]|uniref:metallophosphoesterase n=1 Tax=Variovorax sp. YR634 TaxID=1884385 RepID=UPI000896C53B|nr:metallophosphoesterase [Variovorax sp. YR634]SDX96285.1 3',5'-cyclic AMP phosphodiesterase CpdA [Variovorax sp. YR634]